MDHTKKRFGKKDAVFIGLLLIIAILIFFFTNYFQKETGAMVTVTVDGKVYGTYDLEKEQTIDIKAGDKTTNILKISDGKAKMLTADQAAELIGHAVGGVCPFAVNDGVAVYLDESLKRFETVYPAAGSANSAVRLTPQELEHCIENVTWIDVCK